MASNATYICVPCRVSFKDTHKCPTCGNAMRYMGKHWRPPKRTNNRAWKLIENGIAWWDRRYREASIKRYPGRYRYFKAVPNKNGKGARTYSYDYDMDGKHLLDDK